MWAFVSSREKKPMRSVNIKVLIMDKFNICPPRKRNKTKTLRELLVLAALAQLALLHGSWWKNGNINGKRRPDHMIHSLIGAKNWAGFLQVWCSEELFSDLGAPLPAS